MEAPPSAREGHPTARGGQPAGHPAGPASPTAPGLDRRAHLILRLDGGAGAAAGVLVLALHGWLAPLYGLPSALVLAIGVANLAYGAYSSTLALRAHRGHPPSRRAIGLLAAANLAWAAVCGVLVAVYVGRAHPIGLAVLALEGAFVAALAIAEHRLVRPLLPKR